jgi:hypothetical protein
MLKSTITLMSFLIYDPENGEQTTPVASLSDFAVKTTNTQTEGISSLSDLQNGKTTPENSQTFSLANSVKAPDKSNWQDYSADTYAQKEEVKKNTLKPFKKSKWVGFPKFMGFLVLALILALTVYLYQLYEGTKTEAGKGENESANLLGDDEIVFNEVSKIIMLPEDESPVIRTVTNAKLLSQQSFFKEAQNGDKVLIYQKSQKAILYRPDTGKLVNVASVNLGDVDNVEAPKADENNNDPIGMNGEDVQGVMDEKEPVAPEIPTEPAVETPKIEAPVEETFTESIFGQLNDQKPLVRIAVYTNGYSYDEKVSFQNSIKDQLVNYRFDFNDYNTLQTTLTRNSIIKVNPLGEGVEEGIVAVTNARVYDNSVYKIETTADLVLVLVK